MSVRYGHFELALGIDNQPVELGSGAMATTYRATDTTLHLPVALKIISRHVASRPEARARFLREARAAARLCHPNVASVIYHGEQDGECFYAMELVEGENLAERVRRTGAFTAEEVLEIGVQVARAIAAAEAHGLIHRDLKPSNLMLVGTSKTETRARPEVRSGVVKPTEHALHVKVIDWGLAKVVSAGHEAPEADQTRDAFVGTPAFASPEQFARNADRRIDTRSDIYSLGVTLWYLLCGRVPFVDSTLDGIHARQRVLPLEQLKTAKVPGRLAQVLKSMLALDPADRPQNARELLDTLLDCQGHRRGRRLAVGRRKRFLQAGIALALLMLGVGVLWQHRTTSTPRVPGEQPSLAVLPFENLGTDPDNAFFVTGVQDEITHDLAYVAGLRIVSADSTRSYLPGDRDLLKIGQGLGVRYLLESGIRRESNQIGINVRLTDLRHPDQPWNARYTRPLSEVFAVQGQITRAVLEYLRVPLTDAERAAIDRPPTTSLAAYDLYLRVHETSPLFQTPDEEYRYDEETRAPTLEAAIAKDPKFVLAYCDLADTYDSMSAIDTKTARPEAAQKHRLLAEAALATARRLRPDAGEVHLSQAVHFNLVGENREQARVELELARRELPNDAPLESLAGYVARNQHRWEDALRCFKRAANLKPRDVGCRWDLAYTYRELRRYDEAEPELAEIVAELPPEKSVAFRLYRSMGALEQRANLGPCQTVLATLAPADETTESIVLSRRLLVACLSHDAVSVSQLLADTTQTSFQFGGSWFPKAWFEALAARMRHDEDAARAAFQLARSATEQQLKADINDDRTLGLLAMIDAGLGEKDQAISEARHACEPSAVDELYSDAPVTACNLAVVYAWTGQPDLACETLEPWIDRPAGYALPQQPTYGDFQLNPVWDPLRGNARFDALVARLAPQPKN